MLHLLTKFIVAFVAYLVWIGIQAVRRARSGVDHHDAGELARQLAEKAVQRAKADAAITLDYSPASIEQVEGILGQLHDKHVQAADQTAANNRAAEYGAYIGEAIRRSEPGAHWELDHPAGGRRSFPLHWHGGALFPMAWCHKRILNGPEDNVWHKYIAAKQLRARVAGTADATGSAPPETPPQ